MKLFLDFAFITAFLFNLLILFLLAKNTSKELHKRVLQIIFILITLVLCSGYAFLNKLRFLFYATLIFDESISSFIGPLLLLYVKSIFLPHKGLIKANRKHFIIPVFYLVIITIPSLISSFNKTYLFNYLKTIQDYLPLVILYSLVYCIFSLRILQKAEAVIKHNYSNVDGIDLNWIRRLLIGAILVISIDVLSTLYELWFGELEWNTYYLTSFGVICLVIYLGYHGVLQSKVLISPFLMQNEVPVPLNPEQKKTKLPYDYSQSELIELEQRLHTLMHDHKPFLQEDLTLKSLAELLFISDKKLSAILNQHIQISFYDYVNGFRVEEVIHKMKDSSYDKYTLLAIGLESGFNSKTSFNRTFKKVTSLSPSQYKDQLQ